MSRKSRKRMRRMKRREKKKEKQYDCLCKKDSLKDGVHLTEYEVVYRYKNTTRKMIERIATDNIEKALSSVNEPFEVLKIYKANEKRKRFLISSNIKFVISIEGD